MSDNAKKLAESFKISFFLLTPECDLSYKMSMQGGSWLCIAGSGAGLIKPPATFPRPAHRWRLRREPHSGHSLLWRDSLLRRELAPIGCRALEPPWSSLHRRMMRFPKCVQTKSLIEQRKTKAA